MGAPTNAPAPGVAVYKLHVSPYAPLILHMEQVLKERGVPCLVRNAALGGAAGELPWHETWAELWLIHEKDLAVARSVVASFTERDDEDAASWRCERCGETVEGVFSMCWNCGADAVSGTRDPKA